MPPHKENPKLIQAMKDGKAPLEYLIDSVMDGDAWVHKGGADKYGTRNWLIDNIKASTYIGAIRRHLKAWSEGSDKDSDSGWSHLYHIRACCAIVLDAEKHGTLIDDRDFCESLSNEQMESSKLLDANIAVAFAMASEQITKGEKITCEGLIPEDVKPDDALLQHVVRFFRANDDGSVNVVYKGPFPDVWRAQEYSDANPHSIMGTRTIHTLQRP